jgi:hypothetical protein
MIDDESLNLRLKLNLRNAPSVIRGTILFLRLILVTLDVQTSKIQVRFDCKTFVIRDSTHRIKLFFDPYLLTFGTSISRLDNGSPPQLGKNQELSR